MLIPIFIIFSQESLVPNTSDEIILYCAAGQRSLLSAESLLRMGYKNVYTLAGGIGEWKRAGYNTFRNMQVVD